MVLPRELVADHLDVDLLTHLEPQVADEVLIDPGLKLTHPVAGKSAIRFFSWPILQVGLDI